MLSCRKRFPGREARTRLLSRRTVGAAKCMEIDIYDRRGCEHRVALLFRPTAVIKVGYAARARKKRPEYEAVEAGTKLTPSEARSDGSPKTRLEHIRKADERRW